MYYILLPKLRLTVSHHYTQRERIVGKDENKDRGFVERKYYGDPAFVQCTTAPFDLPLEGSA